MLLVHDGKFHYDDKLTDVFPDFPAYGKAITIRNLLNHTSGLPDYEDLMATAEKTQWCPDLDCCASDSRRGSAKPFGERNRWEVRPRVRNGATAIPVM